MPGRRPRQAGMTLLELIIVIAIVGIAIGLSVIGVRHVRKTALREDTNQVAQVLRSAHNMAKLSGKLHRVVFDLERQEYRIEQCAEQLKLKKSDEEQLPEPLDEDVAAQAAAAGVPPEL